MKKDRMTDPEFLRTDQYKKADNLQARIAMHERFSTNSENWFNWLFDHLQLPDDARILEIGCGPGDLWQQNQAQIPSKWQLLLTDISEGMLLKARENLGALSLRQCCISADWIPFPENSFDAVVGNHMIYHIPNHQRGLSEIQRVLTPRGKLFTATNGENHLKELYEIILGFDPNYQIETGLINYTLESGEELLQQSFCNLQRIDFPNDLHITEVAPLMDYIYSLWSIDQDFFQGNKEQFQEYLQELLDQSGAIFIQKSVGVLVAENPG
jgi:ubiquinone/menaquinone biosynthesis C-methylase UbiE